MSAAKSAGRCDPRPRATRNACGPPIERALELFDLTVVDPRIAGRRREILRAREVVCDFLVGDNVYQSTPESLDRHFLAFARAARAQR